MEPEQRIQEVAETLLAATRRGKLRWDQTNVETAFQAVRPKASALIESLEGDGNQPYELMILNEQGVTVESLRTRHYQGIPEDWNQVLADLYEAARRQALSVDSVLDNLLNDLGD